MANKPNGNLYLIPTPIGNNPKIELPEYNTQIINTIHHFVVEELRTARRFLKANGYIHSIDETEFFELNEHTKDIRIEDFLKPIFEGSHLGLMSEAGTPCTADPGSIVVNYAHKMGVRVIPLVGASSILLALIGSGLNGQQFAFHGYIPIEKNERDKRIKELENNAIEKDISQIFIEAPYRNNQIFDSMVKILQPTTHLCIACGIYTEFELIKTMPVKNWIKTGAPNFHKVPTVFIIGKQPNY